MTVHTTLRIYAIMFTKFKAVDQYRITTRDVSKKNPMCTYAAHLHVFLTKSWKIYLFKIFKMAYKPVRLLTSLIIPQFYNVLHTRGSYTLGKFKGKKFKIINTWSSTSKLLVRRFKTEKDRTNL